MDEPYLTAEELADRWRVKVKTIYNRKSLGPKYLPDYMQVAGRLLFKLSAVKKFEEEFGLTNMPRK